MKEKLVSTINEIRGNRSIIISDEASIKSGVVLRLLSLLGWNPFDVNEVKPEYSVESKRVDFSLRINGTNKVFIEVKRPNELSQPMQIAGSNFFVETKLNSNAIVRRSRELMGLFGHIENDLQVSAE